MYQQGQIDGVIVRQLLRHSDSRGWLLEIFRNDEMAPEFRPVMTYVSETLPGVARGPHEHVEQADTFGFIGPSNFKVYLWDNRKSSATFGNRSTMTVGVDNPAAVTIPPGVVHAYKNVGAAAGWVMNCPNRLYAGEGRSQPVDEIRHEDAPDSPFRLD